MKSTLLMPTYNEIVGMRAIMPRIKREWVDQILIVDAGSTDGTLEYAKELGLDIIHQESWGLWRAYVQAWPHIKGDIVITFSPDGNCIPELIPDLLAAMPGQDMVIVSRYLPPAKSADDDPVTGFGNWMFTSVINRLFRANYTDAMGIFRAYPKSLFYTLDLDKAHTYLPEKFFFTDIGIEPVLSVRAAKRGLKIKEIAGDEPARVGGKRKLQIVRWGSAYMTQVFREYWCNGAARS